MGAGVSAFAETLRSARLAARLSVTGLLRLPLVEAVNAATRSRRDGAAEITRSRYNAIESDRTTNVARAGCWALEAATGLAPDTLWRLLLLDPRKVDPEVRDYYESQIADPAPPPVVNDRPRLVTLAARASDDVAAVDRALSGMASDMERLREAMAYLRAALVSP